MAENCHQRQIKRLRSNDRVPRDRNAALSHDRLHTHHRRAFAPPPPTGLSLTTGKAAAMLDEGMKKALREYGFEPIGPLDAVWFNRGLGPRISELNLMSARPDELDEITGRAAVVLVGPEKYHAMAMSNVRWIGPLRVWLSQSSRKAFALDWVLANDESMIRTAAGERLDHQDLMDRRFWFMGVPPKDEMNRLAQIFRW